MKTDLEKLSPTRVKLNVEVPFDELKPAVDQATKKIADQVQIPGFRKGKVPTRLIEQRFGRPAIMQEAVNDALPGYYQQAAAEVDLKPVGRPEVEVSSVPGLDGEDEGSLVFVVEQDVRPEIDLPAMSSVTVEIEEPAVDDDAVQVRLDQLRERFGTLVGVDRPAEDGDFVSLDMIATIGDEEIESVEGVSYHIGEGNMLEGLDEALIGLSAEETTTFTSKLAGGDRAGEEALIKVTAQSVKIRELPEADDEFAELASEFDTIEELKADLREQAGKDAEGNRVGLARNALLEKLLEDLEIPVPQGLVDDEIAAHLENEGKEAGDPHGEEIREETEKALRAQFLLDALLESRDVEVGQEDMMSYISSLAGQYGVEPTQFIQMLAQSGQFEQIAGEVQRSKALDVALAEVTVKNTDGDELDLGLGGDAETPEDGDDTADATAEKKESSKKTPAKKAPAKKAPAKKASTSSTAKKSTSTKASAAKDEKGTEEKKAPAKKAPAKKASTSSTAKKSTSTKASAAKDEKGTEEKKAPAKKAPAKKAPAKKAPAKKTAAAEESADSE